MLYGLELYKKYTIAKHFTFLWIPHDRNSTSRTTKTTNNNQQHSGIILEFITNCPCWRESSSGLCTNTMSARNIGKDTAPCLVNNVWGPLLSVADDWLICGCEWVYSQYHDLAALLPFKLRACFQARRWCLGCYTSCLVPYLSLSAIAVNAYEYINRQVDIMGLSCEAETNTCSTERTEISLLFHTKGLD